MKAVGVDIGSFSIKVCEVSQTSKGVQVLMFKEHLLGTNPAHDVQLEVLEYLQGLALQYGHEQTKVVLGLKQDFVSVRNKFFPFSDRLKILKTLPFELEEDLPFSAETAIYEARVAKFVGAGAEVVACATPKHRVGELLEKYQSTGIEISTLSAEGLAFANCFSAWDQPILSVAPAPLELKEEGQEDTLTVKRPLRLVIQIGHRHSIVCAFDGSSLVGLRSILWGGQNVAAAIARKYEIPLVDALEEMKNKAFVLPNKDGASYDQIVFSDTISAQFRDLGRELKLSVFEMETELSGHFTNAEITGGASGVLHLSTLLTQLLEIPVNPAQVLSSFQTGFEKTPAIDQKIGTSLGLALEGLRKPRNPAIQLMRGDFAPRNEGLQVFIQTWSKALICGASLVACFFIYTNVRDSFAASSAEKVAEKLQIEAKNLAKLSSKQASESGIKKYIREKKSRFGDMKNLEGLTKMNSALDLLKKISETSPGKNSINLNIHTLKIEDSQVELGGTVGNMAEKNNLQRALASLAVKGLVQSREGSPVPGVLGIPFSMNFQMDRGVAK